MRARIELGFVRACRHGPGERTYRVSAPNSMTAGKYLAKCLRRENSAMRRRNTKQSPGEQTNASEKNPNDPARTAYMRTIDWPSLGGKLVHIAIRPPISFATADEGRWRVNTVFRL